MIKLDPEEEAEEDDPMKSPQKSQMPPPHTSQTANEVLVNHTVTNNVQNNSRVNIPAVEPSQNFVSCVKVSLNRFLFS